MKRKEPSRKMADYVHFVYLSNNGVVDMTDSLYHIVSWNNSQGENACKGRIGKRYPSGKFYIRPCNSTTCFTCHIYGDQMKKRASGMIWRAIGNLMAAGIEVYFVTITLEEITGDSFHDWNQLESAWDSLLRSTRKGLRSAHNPNGNFEYVRLASEGSQNHKPHYHIVSSAPITRENGRKFVLDVHCKQIANHADDRGRIANYMQKNMALVPHVISTIMSSSKNFRKWANPALWRIVSRFPVDVYIAHRSTLDFEKCSLCQQLFPESHVWFQRSGTDKKTGSEKFRRKCKLCQVYEERYLNANKRAGHYGVPGKLTLEDIVQLFERNRHGDKYLDQYTGELIDLSDCVLDHRVPLSRGGHNTVENLRITSEHNNARKGYKLPDTWDSELGAKGYDNESGKPKQLRMFS